MRFSLGWQGCSSGFPSGFGLGKSLEAALPALVTNYRLQNIDYRL
jgi:hypothetical protein